ncbi:MAG: hemolysin III family protein [Oscillospiraceae bacterium]|nr:hemolysin III family protein [Oscillospiraceae bacterium]
MKKRIRLADRKLPDYTKGEEIMNMVTHIIGGVLGAVALVLCVIKAADNGNTYDVIASAIYGVSMIMLYTMSSIYHGLRPGMAKKVMQVIDHCTIYFLISGSYTPFALSAIRPVWPELGWGLFIFEWALTALAVTLTAVDLKKYQVFSMVCYIGMGWAILPFAEVVIEVVTITGFWLLLLGGIAYTIGAVLYGIGAKKRWMHSVFHIFVVLGSLLQFFAVYCHAL